MLYIVTYDQFRDSFRSLGVTNQFQNVFCASMSSGTNNTILVHIIYTF